MKRIKFGEERRKCPECEVNNGEYHKEGCDQEECPICGGQLISCGHEGKEEILDPLEELGRALCLLWNYQLNEDHYSYHAKTHTIMGDTSGFDFKKHLQGVAAIATSSS